MARLHAWTAAGRSGSPLLVDTHRPGAFAVSTLRPPAASRGETGRAGPAPRVALRAFRPPLLAQVLVKDGAPAFVSAPAVRVRSPAPGRPVARLAATGGTSPSPARSGTSPSRLRPVRAGAGVFASFLDRLRGSGSWRGGRLRQPRRHAGAGRVPLPARPRDGYLAAFAFLS